MTISHVTAAAASADPRLRRGMPGSRMQAARASIRAGRRRDRGLFLAGLAASIGVSAGWMWLGTTAVLPLLYLLPCAAMVAMCMKGHGASTEKTVSPNPTSGNPDSGLSL